MTTPINIPQKLAIYYGYPSLVNGSAGDTNLAAAVFKDYNQVVFGQGLEVQSHPDHANTQTIINHPDLANTEVYGYIDATLTLNEIQGSIDKWNDIGVFGIFLDRFGYDFGLTREKQREIIWCVKNKCKSNGDFLNAFVNAWNVDDVFSDAVVPVSNPNGLPTRLDGNDYFLAESFGIVFGQYDTNDLDSNGIKDFQDKAFKMTNYRDTFGTKMAAVTTGDSNPFDQAKADYSFALSVINQFDSWGWGEEFFSASSTDLPLRSRFAFGGTHFTSGITTTNGFIERQTNIGLSVDTNNNSVDSLLNV